MLQKESLKFAENNQMPFNLSLPIIFLRVNKFKNDYNTHLKN